MWLLAPVCALALGLGQPVVATARAQDGDPTATQTAAAPPADPSAVPQAQAPQPQEPATSAAPPQPAVDSVTTQVAAALATSLQQRRRTSRSRFRC